MGLDTSTVAVLVATAALAMNFVVHIFGGGWNLSNKLGALETALRAAISAAKDEVELQSDTKQRNAGEAVAALRQKIHEVETWARDEFVRREGFYKVRDELVGDMKALGDKIEARLERMEGKIDKQR